MHSTPPASSQNVPTSGFAPEFRLALACARWPLRDRDREEIQRIAAELLDWKLFVRIIERNQILPLTYRNLNQCAPKGCPPKILDALRSRVFGFTSHSLSQAAELVRITKKVTESGIELIALKGVTLSMVAYGNVAMRSPGDIDLLVAPTDVFAAERALLDLGYIRCEPKAELTPRRLKHYLKYYKHFAYYHPGKALPLELHWRLYHNTPLTRFYTRSSDTMQVELGPGSPSTLSRDELFLYLCVHGALHGWPILKWLADIGALLAAMDTETLGRIVALASKQGLDAELQSALILVDEFLGIERPAIELPAKRSATIDHIVAMAHRLLTDEGYCLAIDRLPRMGMFFYDLKLRSSWQYRSSDIGRAFILPEDWELIDLPDALFPLYAAIRPISWFFRSLARRSRQKSTKKPASILPSF